MPLTTCPVCNLQVALPDSWAAPGFTCPHCRQAVALPAPIGANPLDFDNSQPARSSYRSRARSRAERSEFMQAFERSLGKNAAEILVGLVLGFGFLIFMLLFVAIRGR